MGVPLAVNVFSVSLPDVTIEPVLLDAQLKVIVAPHKFPAPKASNKAIILKYLYERTSRDERKQERADTASACMREPLTAVPKRHLIRCVAKVFI